MSYSDAPRPFKDPNYRKNVTRRNKTLKQILAGEREQVDRLAREKREREEEQREKGMEVVQVEEVTCELQLEVSVGRAWLGKR